MNGKISIRAVGTGRLEARRRGNDFPSFEAYQFVNGRTLRIGRNGAGLPWELVR